MVADSLDRLEIYPGTLSEVDLNFASCLHSIELQNVIRYAQPKVYHFSHF